MSKHLFNDSDIQSIADSIRTKKGTSNTMTIGQMPTEIASIPSGGGTDYMAQRVQGTLSSYTIPNTCTKISGYAFYSQPISSITIPSSVTEIGLQAFAYCNNLTSITIPSTVEEMKNNVFQYAGLTSVTFAGTYVYGMNYAFSGCSSLKTVNNFTPTVWGRSQLPEQIFNNTALEGDIVLGDQCSFGARSFYNNNSTGILYLHLTQTDASVLSSKYYFGLSWNNPVDTAHCRLVVPVGMLSDYQSAFPNYSSIMIEETT